MPILAKKGSADFVLCPAGAHLAVCCDVVDIGMRISKFSGKEKTQHKIRLVWQVSERKDDGKLFMVSRMYTLSLDDRATLRRDLESWRGRPFTVKELEGFDVEGVLGKGCMLSVVHEARDGKTFDNVNTVMSLPKGVAAPKIEGYIRMQDRPDANKPASSDAPAIHIGLDAPWQASDDDIPF